MTTLSGRTVMAAEKRETEREKVNDYNGTIVSERRRWRTHTLGPKEDGKNAIYITDRLFDAFDLIGL